MSYYLSIILFTPLAGALITRLPVVRGTASDGAGSGVTAVELFLQRRSDGMVLALCGPCRDIGAGHGVQARTIVFIEQADRDPAVLAPCREHILKEDARIGIARPLRSLAAPLCGCAVSSAPSADFAGQLLE